MRHYYNDNDPHACAWTRNLMQAGLVPEGTMDGRRLQEVTARDLDGTTQCHFFSGICGWPYALQLAGWPATRPVWTASCPCQPFSAAGQRRGAADDRHLWPVLFRLIRECRPVCVVGEQVASAVGHGWLDGISADLEGEGYAIGAVVLGAHSVGAPHIRQRLYWVAHTRHAERGERDYSRAMARADTVRLEGEESTTQPGECCQTHGLAESRSSRTGRRLCGPAESPGAAEEWASNQLERSGRADGLDDATAARGQRLPAEGGRGLADAPGASPWDDYTLLPCGDGKTRRAQPGIPPLAHGLPYVVAGRCTREAVSRVQLLKGIGNAIVPHVAAAFLRAYMESTR